MTKSEEVLNVQMIQRYTHLDCVEKGVVSFNLKHGKKSSFIGNALLL